MRDRRSAKRPSLDRAPRSAQRSKRRTPSRIAKERALERIRHDTAEVNGGSLLIPLRKQGYEELPLDEIQDRLSKLRTALAEFIVSRRG